MYCISNMESVYKLNIVSQRDVYKYVSSLCLNPHPAAMALLEERYMDRVDWHALSENPAAGHILKRNVSRIVRDQLSKNPCDDAMDLLKANPRRINWFVLCGNPNPLAVEMIADQLSKNREDKVDWSELMSNPGAIEIIKRMYNEDGLVHEELCRNPHPDAIKILTENMDKINWAELSTNSGAMELLRANPDKIVLSKLVYNTNAGDLMYEMIERDSGVKGMINAGTLSKNPGMMRVLKKHRDLRRPNTLFRNPGIFEYDYEAIGKRCDVYKEEMMERLAHPANAPCFQWLGWDEENVFELEPRGHLIVKPK